MMARFCASVGRHVDAAVGDADEARRAPASGWSATSTSERSWPVRRPSTRSSTARSRSPVESRPFMRMAASPPRTMATARRAASGRRRRGGARRRPGPRPAPRAGRRGQPGRPPGSPRPARWRRASAAAPSAVSLSAAATTSRRGPAGAGLGEQSVERCDISNARDFAWASSKSFIWDAAKNEFTEWKKMFGYQCLSC